MATGKTYQIANVKLSESKPPRMDVPFHFRYLDVIRKNKGTLLQNTQPEYPIHPPFMNGFVGTAYQAYSEHRPLLLRPDDVWLAIVITFANYIDNHADQAPLGWEPGDAKDLR